MIQNTTTALCIVQVKVQSNGHPKSCLIAIDIVANYQKDVVLPQRWKVCHISMIVLSSMSTRVSSFTKNGKPENRVSIILLFNSSGVFCISGRPFLSKIVEATWIMLDSDLLGTRHALLMPVVCWTTAGALPEPGDSLSLTSKATSGLEITLSGSSSPDFDVLDAWDVFFVMIDLYWSLQSSAYFLQNSLVSESTDAHDLAICWESCLNPIFPWEADRNVKDKLSSTRSLSCWHNSIHPKGILPRWLRLVRLPFPGTCHSLWRIKSE